MPLPTPTRFGPYETVSFLGAGGMGEVYEAIDTRLNRHVALKVLPPHLVADEERRRRFVQEAQLASSLQHPHIVTIYDIGSANAADYIAMEFVRGRTLDSVIPNKGLRLGDALRYGVQITDALSAAHAAGIVHRDLKPGNIMVTDQDQIKILDFGLATLADHGMTSAVAETQIQAVETGAGMIVGSVAYMSPEQAEGKKLDARSDIFSFGAIMYEMLSGQRAFRADSTPATLAAVITGQVHIVSVGNDGKPVGRPALLDYKGQGLRSPVWTADGQSILAVDGAPSSNGGVTRIPIDNPSRAQRLLGLERATDLALSRDGTKLVFSRGTENSDLWRIDLRDPTKSGRFAASTLFEGGPEYSPEGQHITFSSNRGGGREIWVADSNGENATAVTNFNGPIAGTGRWSPDSRQIAFDSRPDGNSDIFIVSRGGGPVKQLTRTPGEDARPAWSHDGRWIYFSSDRTGRAEIWRMSIEGGEPVQITRNGGFVVLASPDGQHLFYRRSANSGPIYDIHPDGTGDTVFVAETAYASLPYTTTASALWWLSPPIDGRTYWSLRMLRFADRKIVEAAKLEFNSSLNISVSPDEHYLLMTEPDRSGSDLLLVNDFR